MKALTLIAAIPVLILTLMAMCLLQVQDAQAGTFSQSPASLQVSQPGIRTIPADSTQQKLQEKIQERDILRQRLHSQIHGPIAVSDPAQIQAMKRDRMRVQQLDREIRIALENTPGEQIASER